MKKKLNPSFYLVLEDERRIPVIDQMDAKLLRFISEFGTMSEAARRLGVSYRTAWARISSLEKRFGMTLVIRQSGGKKGGGAKLTENGLELLKNFRRLRKYIFNALDDFSYWQHIGYKFSARNKIRAKILNIKKSDLTSMVTMEITGKQKIVSIISTEAVEDLTLKEGDEVDAIIKATEIIIGKD
jgi:molybdate transport system regulatory protein